MKEIYGNLWDHADADALCITTNGFLKKDGSCVMGKGCAKEAVTRFPGLDKKLGSLLSKHGNRPMIIQTRPVCIVSFPTKPVSALFTGGNAVSYMANRFRRGDSVPGWACKSDMAIIGESASLLVEMADKFAWENVVIPRPGCGAGELDWDEDVKPLLQRIFDNRFSIITFRPKALPVKSRRDPDDAIDWEDDPGMGAYYEQG